MFSVKTSIPWLGDGAAAGNVAMLDVVPSLRVVTMFELQSAPIISNDRGSTILCSHLDVTETHYLCS